MSGRTTRSVGRLGVAALLLTGMLAACRTVGGSAPTEREPPPAPQPRAPEPEAEPEERVEVADPGPIPRPFTEVRGLWVVRHTLRARDPVATMVERAHRAGFNTLLVQVRGRGDAFYDSSHEPLAAPLRDDNGAMDPDPLEVVLREAHRRGMAVHAWINVHLVASAAAPPTARDHVVNAAPDLLAVPRSLARRLYDRNPFDAEYLEALLEHARENRDRVEGLYTSPARAQVRDRIVRVVRELVTRYPLDGLHLDYVRYPDAGYDYSRGALRAFRTWAAPRVSPPRRRTLDRRAEVDPLAWPEALPGSWNDFRREQVTRLVRRIHEEVEAIRPRLLLSAAVFPNAGAARRYRFQDWGTWLREGTLDVAVPMAYTPDDGRFREQISDALEWARDPRRVWAGIGVYRTTFTGTVSKVEIARAVGATGVVFFSYDWAVDEGEQRNGAWFLERVGREVFGRQGR